MITSNVTATFSDNPADTHQEETLDIDPPQRFEQFYIDTPVIGLTGGIGSGKTAASEWFSQKGIDIVDADLISHQVMQKGSPALNKLADKFGDWVIDEDGEMDRKAVRDYVFGNDEALLTLETITHPAIRQEIKLQLAQAQSRYVVLVAPLLLESAQAGLTSLCDRILVIDASEHTQLERASKRDTQSVDKIKAIMANQLPRDQRKAQADDVVKNDGSLEALYEQLKPLHENYLNFKKMPR